MRHFGKRRWYFFVPLIIAGIIAFGFIVMYLWNYTMPGIFNLPQISFWQAICLLLLSRIFFSGGGKPFGHRQHNWSHRIHSKWENMSPEEKEKFSQHWNSGKHSCC